MNKSNNDDTRLIEIQEDVKKIKELLERSEERSGRQWLYNIGFASMIASLAILSFNTWGAVVVFIAGYVIMILAARSKKS